MSREAGRDRHGHAMAHNYQSRPPPSSSYHHDIMISFFLLFAHYFACPLAHDSHTHRRICCGLRLAHILFF